MRERRLSCPDMPCKSPKVCRFCTSAARFLNRSAKEYLKIMDVTTYNKCAKELQSIIHKAGDISVELWGQGTGIRCLWEPKEVAENGFKFASKDMSLHDCMTIVSSDNTLEGKPVTEVIEPAVVSYITRNDTIKPTRKVWGEAVVLVEGWEEILSQKSARTMGTKVRRVLIILERRN